ncbi:MAG: cupredoxin domain-containing protein [Armatimonadota bacterium]|nr:cupredoxin domain-containing protein [Armatimonadota bacterium]MDR7445182.1 cupredoxin domain-containing protein [Armatimonadota bacterium]MDR7571213.1 cupredoxin domain-containing protein [Armatimonadota bacterium]MDR7613717.1 cupredoxin domain-containing protein [Armatimonadota bacterium]
MRSGRTFPWTGLAVGLGVLVAALGGGQHAARGTSSKGVVVEAREFAFVPSRITARRGSPLVLRIRNVGKQKHDFLSSLLRSGEAEVTAAGVTVEGEIEEVELEPGAEAVIRMLPKRAGTFEFWCSVLEGGRLHRDLGMRGLIRVAP